MTNPGGEQADLQAITESIFESGWQNRQRLQFWQRRKAPGDQLREMAGEMGGSEEKRTWRGMRRRRRGVEGLEGRRKDGFRPGKERVKLGGDEEEEGIDGIESKRG